MAILLSNKYGIFVYYRVIISLFGIMLMLGTVYDVFFVRMKLFSKDDYVGVSQEEPLQLKEMTHNETTSEVNGIQNGTTPKVNGTQNGTTPGVNGTQNGTTPGVNGSLRVEFHNEASNKQDIEKIYSVADESRRQEIRRQKPEGK